MLSIILGSKKRLTQLRNWLIINAAHTANPVQMEGQCFYKSTHPLDREEETPRPSVLLQQSGDLSLNSFKALADFTFSSANAYQVPSWIQWEQLSEPMPAVFFKFRVLGKGFLPRWSRARFPTWLPPEQLHFYLITDLICLNKMVRKTQLSLFMERALF